MAAPGFSVSDLIDAAIQVKVVYDAFFNKYTNSASQVRELVDEIRRFGLNLQKHRESFERIGLKYDGYDAIYRSLNQCYDFLDKYKSVLASKASPTAIWRTARFPYVKDDIQHLRDMIQRHKEDLIHISMIHMLDNSTTPNNGLAEPQPIEIAAHTRRPTLFALDHSTSQALLSRPISELATSDPTANSNTYASTTASMSPPSRSFDQSRFHYDTRILSPNLASSSYVTSQRSSPELMSSNTFETSSSPRSSTIAPTSNRLSAGQPQQHSYPELILPQAALDYVVATMWFGSKKVELKRRPVGRSFSSPSACGRELMIIDENNQERLRHRMKVSSKQQCYPYTWNSRSHPPLEVTFKGIVEGNHTVAFKGKPIDLQSAIPRYIFSNLSDFIAFQSAVRGKDFIDSFPITKISSDSSSKYGDATDQHLKIWRDRETREFSVSFYASVLKRPRDLEFPFRAIRKEIERGKRSHEGILRFETSARDTQSNMSIRYPSTTIAAESDWAASRSNTLSTIGTEQTATSGAFFNFSRQPTAATAITSIAPSSRTTSAASISSQQSDSAQSQSGERSSTSTIEELMKKMKYLKIEFSDSKEAARFHAAHKTVLADTPSQPIDFTHVNWSLSPSARGSAMYGTWPVNGDMNGARYDNEYAELNDTGFVELNGEAPAAELSENAYVPSPYRQGADNVYPAELQGSPYMTALDGGYGDDDFS